MPAGISRCALALLAVLGFCPRAQAQEAPTGSPIVLEMHGAWHGPVGYGGLSLVYDRGERFAAGFGLGIDSEMMRSLPPVEVFGRMRALRAGPFSLGLAATVSRGHYEARRTYDRPSDYRDPQVVMTWSWQPGYRATGALAAELAGRQWSLRMELGVGFLLNKPTCHSYQLSFSGDCNSPEIPEPYHFSVEPGRVAPSLTASIGYRFGLSDPEAPPPGSSAAIESVYRSPNTALQLSLFSTLGSVVAGAALLGTAGRNSSDMNIAGYALMGLGISFGPAIGYSYAGESLRGWGIGLLRLAGFTGGSIVLFVSAMESSCDECHATSSTNDKEAVGLLLFGAVAASAIYDIVTAPNAARRSNARHGLTNVALVPVVVPGGVATSHGLALAGKF
ncbi:MAG TPA: hypothetical protein VF518_03790 [Polyangia bacterium]